MIFLNHALRLKKKLAEVLNLICNPPGFSVHSILILLAHISSFEKYLALTCDGQTIFFNL